jgi:hypothetical protein
MIAGSDNVDAPTTATVIGMKEGEMLLQQNIICAVV